jgi:hypothetical protein
VRIWRFADERRHCSKAAAAEWALQRDPSLTAVRDALRQREVDPATSISPVDVQRLLRIVRERVASVRDLSDLAADGTPESPSNTLIIGALPAVGVIDDFCSDHGSK